MRGFRRLQFLEMGEEAVGGVINEEDEVLASDAFGIGGPVAPLELLGDDGGVSVADEFEFLVFLVEDLEEEHPAELLKTLCVTGDAAVLPHDVADVFYDRGNVWHEKKLEESNLKLKNESVSDWLGLGDGANDCK